ncbi:uncharacterized protein EV154DRAFT_497103 [Mucor mucedo]|uniref:uncharacterized protein n=1 Tax=Mucor mucedo TaxID=29922 RepID=UPI00221FBE60|nr:uncharacterized protein EV154DRAFT_497103 [Mucor mucedo]KAI7894813.1 hypothetical protein EV154DRAFT_497103 [Mucor mucedo]
MNRLGFADFHARHFGAAQRAHWQSILKQQEYGSQHQQYDGYQQQGYDENQQQTYETSQQEGYDSYQQYQYDSYQQEYYGTEQQEEQPPLDSNEPFGQVREYDHYEEEEEELSKEAIEIFRFSEAYRLERALERQKEEANNDEEGMNDWQYDESNVLVSGGLEAPATSLVLTNQKQDRSTKIKIQEDLLNSAYLQSCMNGDAPVLWPVLPLKM